MGEFYESVEARGACIHAVLIGEESRGAGRVWEGREVPAGVQLVVTLVGEYFAFVPLEEVGREVVFFFFLSVQ